jgi:uncharacterized metal-binding protein YceD (DUF177 family)
MNQQSVSTAHTFIDGKVKLSRLPNDVYNDFKFDKETDWVRDLLVELNEKASDYNEEDKIKESYLELEFKLAKKHTKAFGEFLILHAEVKSEYYTECVKTLQTMKDLLNVHFKAVFLHNRFENDEQYEEVTEIFVENDVHELYFFNKGMADIKEVFHEQIFLNINQYPTLEVDESDLQ